MDIQNTKQQKASCFYAALNIANSKYSRLYSTTYSNIQKIHQCASMFKSSTPNPNTSNNNQQMPPSSSRPAPSSTSAFTSSSQTQIIGQLFGSFKHTPKKPNQKLVHMHFLKDNNFVVLGYDKQTDRGDINFISVNQLKARDFYYNKLNTGVGGIQCFDDGRNVLIADKKGTFSFIDMFKQLNYNDIQDKRIQTKIDGVLDISLSPAQTKVVCGLSDKKCIILDIQKQRKQKIFLKQKTFDRHIYSVNSVNWHPYKSLIVSSSIHLSDTVKLWDPHSQQLVHETNLHKSIISKVMFHPQGNTYFSLGKDNIIVQHQLRKRGNLNNFNLQFQPSHMQVMKNNNIVIGDSGGYMNWFSSSGQLLGRFGGQSGVGLFCIDQTNNILVVGREREHIFQIYAKKDCLNTQRQLI